MFMNVYECLWMLMNVYECVCMLMNVYECLWMFMNVYEYLFCNSIVWDIVLWLKALLYVSEQPCYSIVSNVAAGIIVEKRNYKHWRTVYLNILCNKLI